MYVKKERLKPFLIAGGIILVVIGLAVTVILTFGKDEKEIVENMNPDKVATSETKEGPSTTKDAVNSPEIEIDTSEVAMINEENVLDNPLIEDGNIISEEEWNVIKIQAMGLLMEYKFQAANELLNEKVVGLSLDEMSFGEDINRLQFDVNHLSFMDGDNGMNEAESVDVDGILRIGKSMQDPERALIAALATPNQLQLDTILYEGSLIPASITYPTIEKVEEDVVEEPTAEWTHMMGVQYPDHQIDRVHFVLDGFPLTATVLKNKDGYYRVWNIYQAIDGKAPYQKKAFWRDYYVKFPQASIIK